MRKLDSCMASNKGDLEGNDISAMIVEQPGNLRDTPPHPPSLLDLLPIPSRSQPLRDLPTEGPRIWGLVCWELSSDYNRRLISGLFPALKFLLRGWYENCAF